MRDPRYQKLADVLVGHSTRLQPGEKALIEVSAIPAEMTTILIEAVTAKGGLPFVELKDQRIQRSLYTNCTDAQMILMAEFEMVRMKAMDVYIGIRGLNNSTETADVPQDRMKIYMDRVAHPVHFEERVNNTKWCVLRWPTPSMAQGAGMSTEAFEDFYFEVCTMDYARMGTSQEPLKKRLEQADRVRLLGPADTDLSFSIKDIPVIPCTGEFNIPDGETFTAPVKESANGVIHFNAPTLYQGQAHDDIRLEFKDGKIIAATGSDTAGLNRILDTDEGARYVGEFSVAYNPHIKKPMRDILFDEKIAGSIHFTPGQAYEIADNGNKSSVHWDMVLIQRPEYGGGELYLDDELIRKDGLFVTDDLLALNPEGLLG
ncbi:MAG: aminopeptidase [Armatimonadota bacterium]